MSFSTHFSLSNLGIGAAASATGGAAAADVKMDAVVAVVDSVDFWEESPRIVVGEEEGAVVEAVDTAVAAGFVALDGEEKKEVMVALTLGFLAVEVAISPALRLRGVAMVRIVVQQED